MGSDRRRSGSKELCAYFESVVFPVLTPLAFDPAHPFPFVSNLSLSLAVELADKKEKKPAFARVKVPPSLSRFVPVPGAPRTGSGVRAAREADRGEPRPAVPRDGHPGRLGVPRHPRRRHRDPRGRGGRPPAQHDGQPAAAEIRRGDPARGRGPLLGARPRASPDPARARSGRRLRDPRAARRRGSHVHHEARSAGPEGRAVSAGVAVDLRPARGRLRDDPQGRHPAPPSLRLLRPGAAVPRGRRGRPGRPRDQDDAVPRRSRLPDGRGARAGRRERQAGRRARRAQGAVRRGEQHPVGPLARARRRARGVRRRRAEDPRQDRARRPARGHGHAPLRPRRHRQLQPPDGPDLHGRRPLHVPGRVRPRRLGALQLPDGLLEEDPVQAARRRAVRPARPADRADRPRSREGAAGQALRDPRQAERARRPHA